MAVLVEGISVIVRINAIEEKYPGGLESFEKECPNETFCADGELARVGFMTPADTKKFVSTLNSLGIVYREGGKAVDIVVADQQRGFPVQCDWAELGEVSLPGSESRQVRACLATGSESNILMTPDGWTYEDSLSADFGYFNPDDIPEHMEFLRREDGLDVYRNTRTGKEVYVARS